MKTNELTGAALDWAVHVALHGSCEGYAEHEYSTDWALGGPIIEREHISIEATRVGGLGDRWMAEDTGHCTEFADAPLIAAMRCYVASKLGDEIEIPKELT